MADSGSVQALPREGALGQWQQEHAARLEELRRALYRFLQNKLSLVGLCLILFLIFVAITGRWWVPYPEDATGAIHATDRFLNPSLQHPFGTDELGRDVFSRVVLGTQYALLAGVIILTVAISIGVTVGSIAGYFGGWIGETLMRVTDMMLAVPGIFLALAITAALGPGILHAMLALSITWWPGYARLVHGQVQAARERDYVEAARSLGANPRRIILSHIVPNIFSSVIVKASMDFGFAILSRAALGFIGVGAKPPTPEWGAMISTGREYLPDFWWYSTFPGLAMFIAVFGFNLLGDGLRDVFDPKSRI
jgi:peptide/nickel transport system permease protein